MKKILFIGALLYIIADVFMPLGISAGPYAPAVGKEGSEAVSYNDSSLIAWASGWKDYSPGTGVESEWQDPTRALGGKAANDLYDIVALGRGGSITLTFDLPVANGGGWDFAIFENGFSDYFLELAYVEVSSDGVLFFRFENDSRTSKPVNGFGLVDPTNIDGFAGKYRQGYGTPFDLAELEGISGLDIRRITHIRIIDIVGDGASFDSDGNVIYDPYPTVGSAGFDLNAVGVRYQYTQQPQVQPLKISLQGEPMSGKAPLNVTFSLESTIESEHITSYEWNFGDDTLSTHAPPLTHTFTSSGEFTVQLVIEFEGGVTAQEQVTISVFIMNPSDGTTDISLTPVLEVNWDPLLSNQQLFQMIEWQIVRENDDLCVFQRKDTTDFHSLEVPRNILSEGMTYMWRIRYFDRMTESFSWSDPQYFHTGLFGRDLNENGIEDNDEVDGTVDINLDGIRDSIQKNIKVVKDESEGTQALIGLSYNGASNVHSIEYIESIDPALLIDMINKPNKIHCGIISFRIKLIDDATSGLVTLHFSENIPQGAKWYRFTSAGGRNKEAESSIVSFEGKTASLYLEDGGKEDMDGVMNGLIICTGTIGYSESDSYLSGDTVNGGENDDETKNDIGCFLKSL